MLDESEFKPFSLTDFTVVETESAGTDDSAAGKASTEEGLNSEEQEIEARLASFKPLTFDIEGDSADFVAAVSADAESGKTDAEKIQLSKGFKNVEFFRENSLLTNAEDFAESIRSGAKLYKTQLISKIEEQASDTERIYQQTISENQEAEKERKNLLSSTEEKVEEIKSKAYQSGLESGIQQGIQQRYDEAAPLVSQISSVLAQLNSLRQVVRFQAEEELVKLALQIAKNVVAKEIKLNNSVIKNIVQAALQETEVQGKIYLFLHPDDYEFLVDSKSDLERYLSDEQSLVLRKNPEMKAGSIYVESDEEIISRSIEGQFDKLEESLTEQIENRHSHLTEVDIDSHDFSIESLSNKADVETDSLDSSQTESVQQLSPPTTTETSPETAEPGNQTAHEEPLPETASAESETQQLKTASAETDETALETTSGELVEPEQGTESVESADSSSETNVDDSAE
jgi:flagellar assembly protein FliH